MAKKAGVEDVSVEIMPVTDADSAIPELNLVPYVNNEKDVVEFTGNFDLVKARLTEWRDQLVKVKLTSKDMDKVIKFKNGARGYRLKVDEVEKQGKKKWFNGPKDIYSGMIAELQALITQVESKADKYLDEEEAGRLKRLNEVFDIYKEDYQEKYKLSDAGLASIEMKQTYYNKTANEAATKADLEAQFKAIKDKEVARVSGEKMIRKLCASNPLLNVEHYVTMLDTTELAIIVDAIEAEETRLAEAEKVKATTSSTGSGLMVSMEETAAIEPEVVDQIMVGQKPDAAKVVLGVMAPAMKFLAQGSDFPDRKKKLTVEIEYPVDYGDALTLMFKELAAYGIVSRPVKAPEPLF